MSPQPDVAALDVQKYIGPCLISQKPRVRKSNRVKEKYGSNNNDNNLVMANNNNNNNSTAHRINEYRKLRGGQSRHPVSSPPLTPAYAICECCGSFKFALGSGCPPQPQPMHHHHLNLPLTGFPLINMTNVAKKQGGAKTNNRNVPIYSQSNRMPGSIGENDVDGSSNLYNWDDRGGGGGQPRGQLSRLAVHTEGVPLILSQRFNSNYRKYKNLYPSPVYRMPTGKYTNNPSPYSSPTSASTMVNCPDFLRDFNEGLDLTDGCYGLPQVTDDLQENNGCGPTSLIIQRSDPTRRQNSPFNSDCMSVTSEESSSLSECNFPRRNVIKLKRRRKRGVNGSKQTSEDVGSSSSSSSSPPPRATRSPPTENLRSLVTLRPYMPLCYNFGENEIFSDWNDDEEDENEEEEDEDEEEGEISGEEEEENFNKRSERFLSSFALDSVGVDGGSVWHSKYPYPASPLCQCATCVPTLTTPPDSPSLTSPSSSSDSGSLSDSISPFPSPPSSPSLTRGTPPTNNVVRYGGGGYDGSELWMTPSLSNYNVATRIVSSYNNTGSKDLEIKFLYDNSNQVYQHYYQQQQSQQSLLHHHHLNHRSDVISGGGDNGVSFSLFDGLDDCSLSPSPDDVSYPVGEESSNTSLFKRPSVVTSSQPPSRPWITLAQPSRTHPVCTFTVMCYNVLCDKYATRQMYGYCPNWALNWDYRRKGIMDEIRHYMADVISLQEVETEQFYNMFLPELKKDGYDGIFSPKSRAKTMNENDRKYVDGCAIFYKANKFRLIKEYLVEFTQLAIAIAEGSDNMLNRVMIRDNIGLVALLETREGAWENGLPSDMASVHQPLLVCTAHIHWDPEYCDVKLIQTMMLMSELQNIVEESARSFRPGSKKCDPSLMPLLLCGDFNSLPNSGVIDFLTSGRISVTHPDFKELAYESCLKKLSSTDKPNEYTHCFKIAKAYSNNIMPFTNFTFDFKGIIDYILHSEQSLVPLGLLGPLDAQWMKENKVVGCPHPHIPSDHFPLVVAFEMTPPQISLTNGLVLRR